MKRKINLSERFKQEISTVEVSKLARANGMTCANTFLAYDENGGISDGAWLEKITGATMYPVISFPFALMMLDDTDLDMEKFELFELEDKFMIEYKTEIFESKNIVDVLVLVWIKHKN